MRKQMWLGCILLGIGNLFLLYLFVAVYVGNGNEEQLEASAEARTICNAYIVEVTKERITAITENGTERFTLKGDETYEELSKTVGTGAIADLEIEGKEVLSIRFKGQRILAEAWEVDGGRLLFGKEASYAISEEFRAYDGERREGIAKEQLAGYGEVIFYLKDDTVCAAVARYSMQPNIRVLLLGNSGGQTRSKISIRAEESYLVSMVDGTKKEYRAEEMLEVKKGMYPNGTMLRIASEGAFFIDGGEVPYNGELELTITDDGIYAVNELPLEQYLYGVLPGEIPSGYEEEAQKAQAICARTYAYGTLSSYRYPEVRANLDDSTNAQVYNARKTSEAAIAAVNATCGRILTKDGKTAATYYYSTSCGMGAAVEEIWNSEGENYLVTKLHSMLEHASPVVNTLLSVTDRAQLLRGIDLSEEGAFRSFLKDNRVKLTVENLTIEEQVVPVDSEYAWYRWSIRADKEEMTKNIAYNLDAAGENVRKGIVYDNEAMELGEIEEVRVTKRGQSGVATEVLLVGTSGSARLIKQTVIRTVLAPRNLKIARENADSVEGLGLLPSAFFYVDTEGDSLVICGGGYGHGVGMSQNGANAMAEAGYPCDEILMHYFEGTQVWQAYGTQSS